jgi:hypothetical protein
MASPYLSSQTTHLPAELTLLIVSHLSTDAPTLCALARTSRSLQSLAEAQLYRHLSLHSVSDLDSIINALVARRERARAVESLEILYSYTAGDLGGSVHRRSEFNECVAAMVNLRRWHVESPYDNFQWENGGHEWVEGDMERFRAALERACGEGVQEEERIAAARKLGRSVERTVGLAMLQELTIHSHGAYADFWELGGWHCLFRHPALRYLHVSCITLPEDIPELATHVRTTPLTTLIFDECQIEPQSLRCILRTPAKLKHLTLGENIFNTKGSTKLTPKLTPNYDTSLSALAEVAHSLESLTHLDSEWQTSRGTAHVLRRVRPAGEGLRHFHSLKRLECDTASFLHQAIVMNPDLAPPNLDHLLIRRHWQVFVDLFDQLPATAPYIALPSLSTLEFVQASDIWNELSLADYICEPSRQRARHAAAYDLWSSRGINLRVGIELHKSASLIPPYLHGETVPVTRCLYDAAEVGFHRHVNPDDDAPAGPEPEPEKAQPPPATNALAPADLGRLTSTTRRALDAIKSVFSRGYRLYRADAASTSDTDGDDDADAEFMPVDFDDDDEFDLEEFLAANADGEGGAGHDEAFLQFIATIQEDGELDEYDDDDEDEDEEGEEGDEDGEGGNAGV